MTKIEIVENRLVWFIRRMKSAMRWPWNQNKQDWRELPVSDLVRMLKMEVAELEAVLDTSFEVSDAIWESVDIANIAFMIADKLYSKPPK